MILTMQKQLMAVGTIALLLTAAFIGVNKYQKEYKPPLVSQPDPVVQAVTEVIKVTDDRSETIDQINTQAADLKTQLDNVKPKPVVKTNNQTKACPADIGQDFADILNQIGE